MKCWECGEDASGICRFCGRAVCKKHATEMPFILSVYCHGENASRAIVVSGALYCGICKPLPSPIEMPELDELR
jgi:hypothetical protein